MAIIELGPIKSVKRYASEFIGSLHARINHTTPKDILNYSRIVDGSITEEDRRRYLSEKGDQILLAGSFYPMMPSVEVGNIIPINEKAVAQLIAHYRTPTDQIDKALRDAAQRKLLSISPQK